MPDNIYPLVIARMTDEEVLESLQHREKYVDEMLLALLDAAKERGLAFADADTLRAEISARAVPNPPLAEDTEEIVMKDLPVLYSQTAILAFTVFFSPIFGGVLLAMNVRRIRKNAVTWVVMISVALAVVSGLVSWFLAPGSFWGILAPIASGLILSELMWNRFIGRGLPYMHRRVLVPLIIALAITLPLALYAYQHPEFFELPTMTDGK